MDEDFLDVTNSGNKLITFVIFLVILAIIFFGYIFVFQKYNYSLKTVKVEVGSKLSEDVNDYLKNKILDTSGYKLDLSKVNVDEINDYTYTVTYNNKTKKGTIKVVDTTPPVFEVMENAEVEVGDEDFYLGDFLSSCEDVSKPCIVSLKNEKDASKFDNIGEYTIKIVVSDIYKNSKETTVSFKVKEKGTVVKKEQTDLEYASSSSPLEEGFEYYIKFDKALDQHSDAATSPMEALNTEVYEKYVSNNYPGYTFKSEQIIAVYNKSDYVIGYVVKLVINNGADKTVYMKSENKNSSD